MTTLGAQLDKVTWADVEHALRDEQCRKEKFQIGLDTALVGVRRKPQMNVKKSPRFFLCGQEDHFNRIVLNRKLMENRNKYMMQKWQQNRRKPCMHRQTR